MSTNVEKLIKEIRSLSQEDQQRLQQALAVQQQGQTGASASTEHEVDVKYQQRLVKAGLLKEVKPRRRDQQAFDRFQAITISGKPLSETIIEERR